MVRPDGSPTGGVRDGDRSIVPDTATPSGWEPLRINPTPWHSGQRTGGASPRSPGGAVAVPRCPRAPSKREPMEWISAESEETANYRTAAGKGKGAETG